MPNPIDIRHVDYESTDNVIIDGAGAPYTLGYLSQMGHQAIPRDDQGAPMLPLVILARHTHGDGEKCSFAATLWFPGARGLAGLIAAAKQVAELTGNANALTAELDQYAATLRDNPPPADH